MRETSSVILQIPLEDSLAMFSFARVWLLYVIYFTYTYFSPKGRLPTLTAAHPTIILYNSVYRIREIRVVQYIMCVCILQLKREDLKKKFDRSDNMRHAKFGRL